MVRPKCDVMTSLKCCVTLSQPRLPIRLQTTVDSLFDCRYEFNVMCGVITSPHWLSLILQQWQEFGFIQYLVFGFALYTVFQKKFWSGFRFKKNETLHLEKFKVTAWSRLPWSPYTIPVMESWNLFSVSRPIFASLGLECFRSRLGPVSKATDLGHSHFSWDFEYRKEMANLL